MLAALQIPRVFPQDPATKVQKQSNPPHPAIQGLKLMNKVDKFHAMPTNVPRFKSPPPPPPGMAADKCITFLWQGKQLQ